VGIEDLKALYKEADLIVQFQADSVQAKPEVTPRLAWEVRGPLVDVVKGTLLPGLISVHVDSVVRTFGLPRAEVEGKQFVAALKPLTGGIDRRFQLVGQYAFAENSKEAEAVRRLADSDLQKGSGGTNLELSVRPIEKAFPVAGPKTIEVRLANSGTDSATYLQAPISEKDGKLYLTGQGALRIRDTTGRVVPDKGNVLVGQVPPPPPTPALILPKASFVENIDLSKYYQLSEGRYTLVLAVATPDGRGRLASNGFSFQVGAVNLPEAPPAPAPPAEETPAPATEGPSPEKTSAGTRPPSAKPPAVRVPDPSKYQPGKPTGGLAGLLRPSKAAFALGEPVTLEFRLVNQGARTLAVDARLERTLTVQVTPVGDSADPRQIDQLIAWPESPALPEERAHLREGAFWGQVININVLPLKPQEKYVGATPEEVAASKNFTYERFAKSLFGFPKPGIYAVTATYSVARPKAAEGQPPDAQHKEWWVGDLQTNTATIQIGEPAGK
jgi:hypothetical protein